MMCGICMQDAEIHAFAEVVSMFRWPAEQAAVQKILPRQWLSKQRMSPPVAGAGAAGALTYSLL